MNIVMAGGLGYHDKTISRPLFEAVNGATNGMVYWICRDDASFFTPRGINGIPLCLMDAWSQLPPLLPACDRIIVLDVYSPVLPQIPYIMARAGKLPIPITAIYHGGIYTKNDPIHNILGDSARDNEAAILKLLSRVAVHGEAVAEAIRATTDVAAYHMPFPYDHIVCNVRPDLAPIPRVVWAHRWSQDKNRDAFLMLMRMARGVKVNGDPIEFVITDEAALKDPMVAPHLADFNLTVVGWRSAKELFDLCREGGYAFGAAHNELAAYAVHELVSYGLHPLVNDQPAYEHFTRRCINDGGVTMLNYVKDLIPTMTPKEWDCWRAANMYNTERLASFLMGA